MSRWAATTPSTSSVASSRVRKSSRAQRLRPRPGPCAALVVAAHGWPPRRRWSCRGRATSRGRDSTHSLEVAQIGRELGQALGCDPDLVETAGLAHDLGHPPFGHNGEQALDEVAQACGGFEGNAQSLRILTRLETKWLDASGRERRAQPDPGDPRRGHEVPVAAVAGAAQVRRLRRRQGGLRVAAGGSPSKRRCLEAQVMDWADDIAYSVHDFEDAIHAGHLHPRSAAR